MDPTHLEYAMRKKAEHASAVAATVKTVSKVFTLVGAGMLVVGTGLLVMALWAHLTGPRGGAEGDPYVFVPLAAAPILLFLGAAFFFVGRRVSPDTAKLMEIGLHGTATLVEVLPGGMRVTTGSGMSATQSRLALDVTVDDGRPVYRVEHRTFVPMGSVVKLVPGRSFPVRVHPSKPKRLAIVWGD